MKTIRYLKHLFVALCSIVIIATTAPAGYADGSVTLNRAHFNVSQGQIRGLYDYEVSVNHPFIDCYVSLWRRPGSSTSGTDWVLMDDNYRSTGAWYQCYVVTNWFTYSCSKDYRVYGNGTVANSAGNIHLNVTDTKIMQNTC